MFELIYTSYPRGLQSGISGFNSVAYTKGMPKSYIQLCESLSGYPFIYPFRHPMYEKNPEIYSHYRFRMGKEDISVLSRVAASGVDYTGRENKIAHHIILNNDERLNCLEGPAYLMMKDTLFVKQWDKNPTLLEPKRVDLYHLNKIEISNSYRAENSKQQQLLKPWKNFFNNSDPSLMIAKSTEYNLKMSSLEIPSFILFDLEDDTLTYHKICLNLVADALNLVSTEIRWNVTFNTYFVSKPIDSCCIWRFCPIQKSQLIQTSPLQNTHLNYATNIIEKYPDSIVIDLVNRTVHNTIPTSSINIEEPDKLLSSNVSDPSALSNFSNEIHSPSNIVSSDNSLEQHNSQHYYDYSEKSEEQYSALYRNKNQTFISLAIFTAISIGFLYLIFSYYDFNIKTETNNIAKKDDIIKGTAEEQGVNQIKDSNIKVVNSQFKANKDLSLSFYEDSNKVFSNIFADSKNFEDIKLYLIKKDGMKIDTDIESPIASDTQNWDIIPKGTKEPIGNISINRLSLYDKELYAAIYIDVISRAYINWIWTAALNITPSMIVKGSESDTLEIRFSGSVSELLSQFLSTISSETLTGVVEFKKNSDNSIKHDSNNGGNSVDKQENREEARLIFYPICRVKIEKKENIEVRFIELKFAETSNLFNELNFKEFQINYTDKQSNKIYPILCLNCK